MKAGEARSTNVEVIAGFVLSVVSSTEKARRMVIAAEDTGNVREYN